MALAHVSVNPEEDDPTGPKGHGYMPVCRCGATFHHDKWRLQTRLLGRLVSTVHLELDHSFGAEAPVWYETMIFGLIDEPQWRYHTREEAIQGHRRHVLSLVWRLPLDVAQRFGSRLIHVRPN